MRVHQYPSSVENSFNCVHFTGRGPCVDVVRDGVVIEAELFGRIGTEFELTSQERLAQYTADAAKTRKAAKDNVLKFRAEHAKTPFEPEIISIDELVARDEGDDHEESEAA